MKTLKVDWDNLDSGMYRMPGEFEPHDATFLIWPWRPGSWGRDLNDIYDAYVQLVAAIAPREDVVVLANRESFCNAQWMLKGATTQIDEELFEKIYIVECENDDAWARDTGATFVLDTHSKKRIGIDWGFNAWGGTYNGLYAHYENDICVASNMCKMLDDDCIDATDFILEGGSIHADGEGTLITTKECLLSKGRNSNLSQEEIENRLKKSLGVKKIIWLPYGIYNDETDGHVDNICTFVEPGKVLLAWTDDENDPQYDRSVADLKVLEQETDACGRKIEVIKLPIPKKPIILTKEEVEAYDFEEGEDVREPGERLAASYVNHYIINDAVIVPIFNDVMDDEVIRILSKCYKGRQIIPIYARAIIAGGGNIHCITQQVPQV